MGRRCWADPPPFRPIQTARPGFPLASLPHADATSLHTAPPTWRPYAGVVDAPRPTGLIPVGTPPRAPRPLHCIPSPLPCPSSACECSSRSSSAAAPLPESSAAHRRPHQWPILGAKTTAALVFAAVSPCARSTEVRERREPWIARRSFPDLVGVLRRVATYSFLPRFACFRSR